MTLCSPLASLQGSQSPVQPPAPGSGLCGRVIPSVLSTASTEPAGLLSQGALRLPCTTAYFTRNAPVTEATLRHEQPIWSRSFTPDCNWLRKNFPFPTN